ncbi:polymer-forming cytoskeletal protein [Shewanella amazonensis]|uniref:Integral membrane protein CcmA involved in cell shape determination-like protein n=1 Tax=Shewanella amazonensis (strain ATCC BAA-1098 / SB2B) TaxID=326297 RepID=A1S3H3_SHEAM|nr:polymer-forming cytoskeletal protein [Shewanella amazonensis]ABL98929.1 integral membrane protein CcmA involved in cell shape determination-like protein [Shewanella amazonensis SB2B]
MSKGQGITFIGAGTRLEGEMMLESAALVSGELHGRVSSKGQIKIEQGGLIEGELTCHELNVSGTFRGKLSCQKLTIIAGGVVEGEVASNQMEIFEGGQFIGSRKRGPEPVELPAGTKASLPTEGRKGHLKLVLGIAAALGLGYLVTQTGFIQGIKDGYQAGSAARSEMKEQAQAPSQEHQSQALMATAADGDASGLAAENINAQAGDYFAEDTDAMEAGNALLLENGFDAGVTKTDTDGADDAQPAALEPGAQSRPLTPDSDTSALNTQGASDLPAAPANRM